MMGKTFPLILVVLLLFGLASNAFAEDLGIVSVLETIDTITSDDGYRVRFIFRGIVDNCCYLFVEAAPESGHGGYAVVEVKSVTSGKATTRTAIFNFQRYRYTLKYLSEQVIQITKEVY